MKNNSYADATGRLYKMLPPGQERDEFIGLVRIGVVFKGQHRGKRPEHLQNYIQLIVSRIAKRLKRKPTFEELLDELEVESTRRSHISGGLSPVEEVNRIKEIVIFYTARQGQKDLLFKTIRNKLAKCKIV